MINLIQITDFHLQESPQTEFKGVVPEQRLKTVINQIKQQEQAADVLLMTGDLSHHGYPAAYQRIADYTESMECGRVRWLPGNHDNASLMSEFSGLSQRVTELGNWVIITLDTTSQPDGKGSGSLDQSELDTLLELLDKYADRFVCIAMHHNPVQLGSDWQHEIMLANADAFWNLLQPFTNVKLILCGHLHQEHAVEHQGAVLLATPATAAQFDSDRSSRSVLETDLEKSRPAYRQLILHDDGSFESEVIRI